MKLRLIIALVACSLICNIPAISQIIPLGEAGTNLYYNWQDHLKALHQEALYQKTLYQEAFDAFDFQLAPYLSATDVDSISDVSKNDISKNDVSRNSFPHTTNSLTRFRWHIAPGQRIDGARNSRVSFNENLRAGVSVRLTDRLYAQSAFILDENLANDSFYSGKVWRGLAGDVETAALTYKSEKLALFFGRYRASWGPTRVNLLLSETARPLDGFGFRYRLSRKFSFSYQLSRLDGISPDDPQDTVSVFVKRYFAAHRLDIRPHRSFRIGLFESIIFAGPGRGLELQFFNPLIFFHANQLNENNNDNTFLGFDFDWWPRSGINIYGQALIDDFQIEKKALGDQEPDELGWIVGTHLVDQVPGIDVRLQWDRVTNRTYNQKLSRNRYLNQNQPLGHPLGNDFELYQIEFTRWIRDMRYFRFSGSLRRSGEGGIRDQWTEPWLDISGEYSEPFPTGIVEREMKFQLEFQGMFSNSDLKLLSSSDRLQAGFAVGWSSISNYQNISGLYKKGLFASFGMTLFLSGDIPLD